MMFVIKLQIINHIYIMINRDSVATLDSERTHIDNEPSLLNQT